MLVVVSAFVALLGCRTTSESAKPLWAVDLESAYPSVRYVAVVGYGASPDAARSSALSDLAGYFGMRVQSQTEIEERFREVRRNDESRSVAQTQLLRAITTSSATQLVGTGYSQLYRDADGLYSIVAYLDRVSVSHLAATILEDNDRTIGSLKRLLTDSDTRPSVELGAAVEIQSTQRENREIVRFRQLLGAEPYDFDHDTTGTTDQVRTSIARSPIALVSGSAVPDYVLSGIRDGISSAGLQLTSSQEGRALSLTIEFSRENLTSREDVLTYRYQVSLSLRDGGTIIAAVEFAENVSGTTDSAIDRRARGVLSDGALPILIEELLRALRDSATG